MQHPAVRAQELRAVEREGTTLAVHEFVGEGRIQAGLLSGGIESRSGVIIVGTTERLDSKRPQQADSQPSLGSDTSLGQR